MELTKTSKNNEISAVFAIDNTPRVYAVFPTSNPEIFQLGVIGNVDGIRSNTVSKMRAKALNWSDGSIQRTLFPMDKTVLSKYGSKIVPGTPVKDVLVKCGVVDTTDNVFIQVVDSLEPSWDDHEPRQTADGDMIVDKDGNLIYRITQLECGQTQHFTIVGSVKKEESVGINTSNVLPF